TVCDNAAQEVCPVWPGQPVTAHWGVADPATARGSAEEIERAFREAFLLLDRRIDLLLNLPLDKLDRLALNREMTKIGRAEDRVTGPAGYGSPVLSLSWTVFDSPSATATVVVEESPAAGSSLSSSLSLSSRDAATAR